MQTIVLGREFYLENRDYANNAHTLKKRSHFEGLPQKKTKETNRIKLTKSTKSTKSTKMEDIDKMDEIDKIDEIDSVLEKDEKDNSGQFEKGRHKPKYR